MSPFEWGNVKTKCPKCGNTDINEITVTFFRKGDPGIKDTTTIIDVLTP